MDALTYITLCVIFAYWAIRSIILLITRKKAYIEGSFQRYIPEYDGLFPNGKCEPKSNLTSAYEVFFFGRIFRHVTLKGVRNASNTLVALGIFGTFLGLAAGLPSHISFNSSDELVVSISQLLAGMKTAFYSSLAGMGLSIFYSLSYRHYERHCNKVISNYCEALDAKYYLSPEMIQNQMKDKIDSIGEKMGETLGTQVVNGLQAELEIMFKQIEDTLSSQLNAALNSAATHIENSSKKLENVSKLVKDGADYMVNQIQAMRDVSDNCKVAIKDLNACLIKIQEGTSEFGDAAIQVSNSLQPVAKKLSDFASQIDQLEKFISSIINAENKISTHIDSLSKATEQHLSIAKSNKEIFENQLSITTNLTDFKKQVDDVFSALNRSLQEYIDGLKSETIKIVGEYTKAFTNTCQSLQTTTNGINSSYLQSVERFGKEVGALSKFLIEIKENANEKTN